MFRVPGVAIQAKNNTDRVITLLCCEKSKTHLRYSTCLVHVMVLLLYGDFASSRQKKLHNNYREKYHVFVQFFQDEETHASSIKELKVLF